VNKTLPEPLAAESQPDASPPPRQVKRRPPLWREIAETLLLALVAFALLRLVVQNYRVEGSSMEPTLHQGQFLVVNKLAYHLGSLQRGDIVVFRYPHDPNRSFIKRVIGLPGDQLEIVDGELRIDGSPLVEPYIDQQSLYPYPPTTIEADQVFVLGDNRNNSSDSRRWGGLPVSHIIGKALFCYWPPPHWGIVRHERPAEGPVR
jgi:signal peptidase I